MRVPEYQLRDLLKEDGHQTCRELGEKMKCDCATISRHLQSMGFTQKLGAWVPHKLTQKQKDKRLSIAAQNLARHHGTYGHKQRFFIFLQKIPELVFVHLDWSSGTRSVVEVEITTFESGKPISNSSLCYSVLSICSTNILGNFTRFLISIKSEKKEVSKIRFFIDLTIHLTVLKNEKT